MAVVVTAAYKLASKKIECMSSCAIRLSYSQFHVIVKISSAGQRLVDSCQNADPGPSTSARVGASADSRVVAVDAMGSSCSTAFQIMQANAPAQVRQHFGIDNPTAQPAHNLQHKNCTTCSTRTEAWSNCCGPRLLSKPCHPECG